MTGLIPKYDWGHILIEIAAKIRQHIELYDDYEAFSEVCSTWRMAIKEFPSQYINRKHTQLPLIMLVDPDNSSYRRYYSLTKRMLLNISLPPVLSLPQTRRYFSSRGWLVSVTRNISKCTDVDYYFNISIFNPFSNSNVIIEAPMFHIRQEEVGDWNNDNMLLPLIYKVIISTCPNAKVGDNNDFVVAMIFGPRRKVAYWRLGHGDIWVVPYPFGRYVLLHDLCFFRGELYATQSDGVVHKVIAFDFRGHTNNRQPRVVADLGVLNDIYQLPADMEGDDNNYYLVESKCDQGSLLFIHRFVLVESYVEHKYNTASFNVFKVNVDNGNVEDVKSLGNQAIFVGFNSTFGVLVCANVDDDRGCKPDCIYYTDDSFERYFFKNQGGGGDMGIYSLPQENTVPCYEGVSRFSVINPPAWIELSSASSFSM